MALYVAWACQHGIRRWPLSWSHPATRRVSNATTQPDVANTQRAVGVEQEDLPHIYRLPRRNVAAGMGDKNCIVGPADVHDGQSRGSGGHRQFGLSGRGEKEDGKRVGRWRCDICEKSTLEMLPDADEQGREKRQEALPEGLQVQLNAPSHKPSSASSDTTQSDPIPTRASSDQACEPTMSTAAPTAAAPTSQLHYRPPATTAAPTPTTSSTSSAAPTPSVIRVSAIEQKLSVIDNCIKALGILVALLIVKRLI